MESNKQKIINILKHFEIEYWTHGNNVSVGSVNVQCPFCSDTSNHCGVFQDTMLFNCWRCSTRGSFEYLLSELTHFSEAECTKIVEDFDSVFRESTINQIRDIFNKEEAIRKCIGVEVVDLPEFFEKITLDIKFPLLFNYLKRRCISLDIVIKARCGICRVGDYANRMIIPIFLGDAVVAYQAADLTGRAEVKYRTGPKDIHINDYLYNYDYISKKMRVVEGILDAWAMGEDTVATFGTHVTERQRQLILNKDLDELIFAWDGGTWFDARRESEFFAPFIETIKIVELPGDRDPDEIGREVVLELEKDI